VLVGTDHGPTPVEYLLHAIAACLTAGIANIAAVRGVALTKVESSVEGDIDLLGILGLSDGAVRNGYEQVRVSIRIEGDADDETLRGIVEQSRRRSAGHAAPTRCSAACGAPPPAGGGLPAPPPPPPPVVGGGGGVRTARRGVFLFL